MCKIRLVHFSKHDTRKPLSTQLFSDPLAPQNGDFISCGLVKPCDCGMRMDPHLDLSVPFEPCPWHNCCAMWYQTARCKWYWDNRLDLQLDVDPEPEYDCPNCYLMSEYHPLSTVVDGNGEEGGSEVLLGAEWVKWVTLTYRPFPADLLYSHEIVEQEEPSAREESYGLFEDRTLVQEHGVRLWRKKAQLREKIGKALVLLDQLEQDLAGDEGLRYFVTEPLPVVFRIQAAERSVMEVRRTELEAAALYGKMMKRAGFVFTALHKMPGEGESVTTPDGSLSISREQLDLAELSPSDIVDECDGPLKQAEKLLKRLDGLDEILLIPRKVNQARAKRSKGPRRGAEQTKSLKAAKTEKHLISRW